MIYSIAALIWIVVVHTYLHFTNPYARNTMFRSPYRTWLDGDQINFAINHKLHVYGGRLASWIGYYKSGFLIVQNTIVGGRQARGRTAKAIIDEIHAARFDSSLPYLISGDQFSVLYPRNLGVFYNQILDPNTAHDATDWQNRQSIYLRSVLIAIDGLSASNDPRTTIVPIGPRHAVLTQVHPGGVGSDQVYGLLYALSQLCSKRQSIDGRYVVQTQHSARRILDERQDDLATIVDNYREVVFDKQLGLVRTDLHLASARDGVIRSSSFYDNVIYWKTLALADELGIIQIDKKELKALHRKINVNFWNDTAGYYNDDLRHDSFSADWLIGFPTGFFDLTQPADLRKTERVVAYLETTNLLHPFPIKYQQASVHHIPFIVRVVVPAYGGDVIWSYWGSQYITLLVDLYEQTGNKKYYQQTKQYLKAYEAKIIEDKGFAETYDQYGNFLRSSVYKSIRITGWVVQYEHARERFKTLA